MPLRRDLPPLGRHERRRPRQATRCTYRPKARPRGSGPNAALLAATAALAAPLATGRGSRRALTLPPAQPRRSGSGTGGRALR